MPFSENTDSRPEPIVSPGCAANWARLCSEHPTSGNALPTYYCSTSHRHPSPFTLTGSALAGAGDSNLTVPCTGLRKYTRVTEYEPEEEYTVDDGGSGQRRICHQLYLSQESVEQTRRCRKFPGWFRIEAQSRETLETKLGSLGFRKYDRLSASTTFKSPKSTQEHRGSAETEDQRPKQHMGKRKDIQLSNREASDGRGRRKKSGGGEQFAITPRTVCLGFVAQ
ncbi:hypothetical protein TIFTF001_051887 [Ficus carica]|uniref:Uncharacterized protein n=1 Tax=Ficus carica TaxID=3494 RepID=A0AA88JEZ9_FICCA|nr:hypothetical protein TIFTF001_051887 [Ficus carica]